MANLCIKTKLFSLHPTDIYYLSREIPASDKTALQAVMEADAERIKLEKLAESLVHLEDDESQEYLMEVYDR